MRRSTRRKTTTYASSSTSTKNRLKCYAVCQIQRRSCVPRVSISFAGEQLLECLIPHFRLGSSRGFRTCTMRSDFGQQLHV